ncbi:MAG: tripartite tricarboxylate transporter substrate binding protein [Rhizobiales bacterium]|nr:tripartite tricarboxylate transporter substrate binding protein [Hyphomicrobiales bacterium]
MLPRFRLLWAILSLTLGVHFTGAAASAQGDYPPGPIEVIVPFAAGGGVDVMGRVAAEILRKSLNRTFVVSNRPGANSNIGNQFVARAKPDGNTLLVSSVGLAANKALYKNLTYDPLSDFTPVSLISNAPLGLFVNKSVPANDLKEFIAYLKANPGKLNYASYGVGSSPYLATELFQFLTGTKMVHVPFKGNGPAVSATLGDTTQVIFCSTVAAGPFVENGELKALAYANDTRARNMPSLPTFIERGVDFKMGTWFGLLGPANLPPALVQALNAGLKQGISSPDVQKRFDNQGADAIASSPNEFAQFLKDETARFADMIRNAGIAPE